MPPIQAPEEALAVWVRVYSGRDPDAVLRPLCAGLARALVARPDLRRQVQEHLTDRLGPVPDFVARLAGVTARLGDAPLGELAAEDPDVASFLVRHPHVIPFLLEQQREAARGPAAAAAPVPPLPPLSAPIHAMFQGHEELTPPGAAPGGAPGTLLERARAGEAEAWQLLAQLLVPLIYYWCRSAGLPEWDAQQLAPQVFQKARAEVGASRPEGPFRGWLRALTAAAVADFAARQGRSTVALEGTTVVGHGGEEAEHKLVIGRALELFAGALDAPTREVGRRLLVRGEPAEEVARALSRSPEQVHALHARARDVIDQLVGDLIE